MLTKVEVDKVKSPQSGRYNGEKFESLLIVGL